MDLFNLVDFEILCVGCGVVELDLFLCCYGFEWDEVFDFYYGGEEGFE